MYPCIDANTTEKPRSEKNNEETTELSIILKERKVKLLEDIWYKKCSEVIEAAPYFKVFFCSEIEVQQLPQV